jgi:hypothetical protein
MNFNQPNKIKPNNNLKTSMDYLSQKMPSVNKNHPNPIETLSPDDIVYLQAYLEQIKLKKINENSRYNNPDYNEPRNSFGMNSNLPNIPNMRPGFLDSTTKNRANDIYDPLDRNVPVDWRTYNNFNAQPVVNLSTEPGSRGAAYTRPGKRSQQNIGLDHTNNYYNPYEYGSKQNFLPPQYKSVYNGPYDIDPVILNQMGIRGNQNHVPNNIRNINVESSLLQREMTHIPGQREITDREVNRFELLPFDPQDHRHIVWSDNMPRGGYPTRTDRLAI